MAAITKGEKPALTRKQKKVLKKEAITLQTVLDDFNSHWNYTSTSWHRRWEDNYKLYNNERIKRGYLGISDTFVPMTFSTVQTHVSALFGSKPKFQYQPPRDKADQDTAILNATVDYFWDEDQWSLKIIDTGIGMKREGSAVDYFMWDIDHPVLIHVPIRDFFIHTAATEISERTTRSCGRRYITYIDELERFEVVDPETGEMLPKYKNLDKLKGDSASEPVQGVSVIQGQQKTDKQEKDMLYGSTTPDDPNQVEVIEYWTVDRVISVANRRVVIEDAENYYKTKDRANQKKDGKKEEDIYPTGILPFADARDYPDASLFYAKSEVDFIADQQEDLNDFSNQEKDAISFNLNQQKTLDPKYKHLMDEIENIPGEIIPVEASAYQPVPTGVIPAEAFNERMNIKNEIRETSASNEVIKGASQTGPNSGTETATAVNAQVAGSAQRIGLKVTQLENGYFHRMANIVFRMIQLFVTEPIDIPMKTKNGSTYAKFDPKEFTGKYRPRVQLNISAQQQQQKQQADSANLLKAFLNDPNVDQRALTKLVLQRGFDLDPDEVEELLIPMPQGPAMGSDPTAVPGAGLPQGAGAPGMPPTGPPPKLPSESITFKDAVAAGAIDSAAAMLEQAGLPANDIKQQRPAPGQVVGGQVHQPMDTTDTTQSGPVQDQQEPIDPETGLPQSASSQLPPDITPEELQALQHIHATSGVPA